MYSFVGSFQKFIQIGIEEPRALQVAADQVKLVPQEAVEVLLWVNVLGSQCKTRQTSFCNSNNPLSSKRQLNTFNEMNTFSKDLRVKPARRSRSEPRLVSWALQEGSDTVLGTMMARVAIKHGEKRLLVWLVSSIQLNQLQKFYEVLWVCRRSHHKERASQNVRHSHKYGHWGRHHKLRHVYRVRLSHPCPLFALTSLKQ